ncbi:hypothetical protein [Oribacterium sp. NK2B42]|uniref:hypothetical protein n=1 Tax=Oribacterium sp. NK2B42 TaxID=689781 RepID=UPI001FA73689|nr:hypothetical protein [Oribacterium sp. NK2B42]
MFLLFGFCIPSSVLSASASEFVETVSGNFQWYLLTYPATVYAGLFLLWTSIYYYFTSGRERIFLFGFMLIVLGVSLINYFIFDVKPEFYYTDLSFDGDLVITGTSMLLNLVAALVTVMILFVLWLKKQEVLKNASLVVAVSLLILGVNNTVQIPKALKNVTGVQKPGIKNEIEDYTGSLHLSKNKKNVVILMLDRAIGSQVPFIFDELPKLKDDFDGFVYYPNTISYAKHTILGAPPLYGGYEYTPKILAENAEGNDWEKRAEAMRVLPVLFSDNGFDSTVCDPAFYGLSNYKDYPKIKTFKLVGHFNGKYEGIFDSGSIPVQMRNFLIFSIYKTAPLFMKDAIYDTGKYMTPDGGNTGLTQAFIDNYTALMELPNLTSALDSDEGSFIFLQNSTTHEPSSFDPPEYEVKPDAGNKPVYGERMVGERNMKIEDYSSWKHYCVNVVSYKELTKWFGAMKKLGVYDNTRIILAADHGAELGQFDDLMFSDGCDAESVNPLLMVKDFGAKGPLTTSDELMTNADVPVLATEGIIENAANPFTGVPINSVEKENGTLWVECGVKRQRTSEEDNLSVDDIIWWTVHDNIFDRNNWTVID